MWERAVAEHRWCAYKCNLHHVLHKWKVVAEGNSFELFNQYPCCQWGCMGTISTSEPSKLTLMWNDRGFHRSRPTVSLIVIHSHTHTHTHSYPTLQLSSLGNQCTHSVVLFPKNGSIHRFQLSCSFSLPKINVFNIEVMILIRQLLSELWSTFSINYSILTTHRTYDLRTANE